MCVHTSKACTCLQGYCMHACCEQCTNFTWQPWEFVSSVVGSCSTFYMHKERQRSTHTHTHTDRERERVYMKKCEFVCVCVFVSSSLQVGIPIVSLIIIMARAQNDMNCIYRYTTTFVTGTGHAPVLLQKYFHQNPFVLLLFLRFLCNNNIKLVYLCKKIMKMYPRITRRKVGIFFINCIHLH